MRRNPARRFSQAVFLTLFFYSAGIFFKTDPLIIFVGSISERTILPGIILSVIMLLLTLILGRFFCGWACPLGTTLDLIGGFNRKKSVRADNEPLRLGFFILAILAVLAFLGMQFAWFFDPIAIMARSIALNSAAAFVLFLCICVTAFFAGRLWCRALCPLGALYGLAAKLSRFLRPGIRKNAGIINDTGGISRRDFIFLLVSSVFMAGFAGKKRIPAAPRRVIRPPAALEEKSFVDRCIRCGSCIKTCATKGLQPVMLESGPEGIWTPHLVPEIGYCDYDCARCGSECPTGAIRRASLQEKRNIKIGLAEVDRSVCLAWSLNQQCLICEKQCPIPEKAIKVRRNTAGGIEVGNPVVDRALCIGCGVCQNKCPVRPVRAIRVFPS